VLPSRLQSGRVASPTRTAVDSKLLERTGMDEFTLRRLRKEFMLTFNRMSYAEKRALAEGGTCPRFTVMISVMRGLWDLERWDAWLTFMEHPQRDVDEMCSGEYPISPYLIRVFSALFGIKVDYLLLGSTPVVDKVGANIEVWPLTGAK